MTGLRMAALGLVCGVLLLIGLIGASGSAYADTEIGGGGCLPPIGICEVTPTPPQGVPNPYITPAGK